MLPNLPSVLLSAATFDWGGSLLIGVVSGLVATTLIVLCGNFWRRVIEPYLEEFRYGDARIEGVWNSSGNFVFKTETGTELIIPQSFRYRITRRGHDVTATITGTSGPDEGSLYRFRGEFRNLILTGTYVTDDRAAVDRGSMTVMLINNGNTMIGHLVYYCYLGHDVKSCDYRLDRVGFIPPVNALES